MPSNANIVINDGASTPVAHTFKPLSVVANLATFREATSTGVPVGNAVLTYSVKAPTSAAGAYTVQLKLTQPKVITVTDTSGKTVTTVDHTDLFDASFKVSATSTAAERKNIRVLASNALVNAVLAQAMDDLESFW